jgi:hypothetical protein
VLPGLAATSVCWRIERERGKRQPGGAPQPGHRWQPPGAPAQEDGEARRRNFPRPPGSAGRSRRTRRRHQAPRNPPRDGCWRTGPGGRDQPPPWLPGATEGNTERAPAAAATPTHGERVGRPPDRQHLQRVSTPLPKKRKHRKSPWRPVAGVARGRLLCDGEAGGGSGAAHGNTGGADRDAPTPGGGAVRHCLLSSSDGVLFHSALERASRRAASELCTCGRPSWDCWRSTR